MSLKSKSYTHSLYLSDPFPSPSPYAATLECPKYLFNSFLLLGVYIHTLTILPFGAIPTGYTGFLTQMNN